MRGPLVHGPLRLAFLFHLACDRVRRCLAAFDAALPDDPRVERRKMFGYPAAFALAAVVGLALGCRRHGRTIPLGLAIVGALLVIGSMYGPQGIRAMLGVPSQAVELIGFVGLIAAAVWDWRL